jgi:hypothetical protein
VSIQKTVRNSCRRGAITTLVSVVCLSAVIFATNASAQGNIARKVDVRAGQSCSKKFASTVTNPHSYKTMRPLESERDRHEVAADQTVSGVATSLHVI